MTDTTKIGLKIVDGGLFFDPVTFGRHKENLVSWLENLNPDDLLYGDFRFDVEVEVEWVADDGGPTLHHVKAF